MSKKSLWLFLLVGVAWGLPYSLIRVTVEEFSTPTIIFSRVVIGALVLIPIAIHRKVLIPALKAWPWVLAYAALEMIGPWFLIPEAERQISSGLAGLLVATVPFFGLIIGYFFLGDKSLGHPKTLIGLLVGFSGVVLLVGIDALSGHVSLPEVGMVILASAGYAIAPVVATHKMPNVSAVAINGLAMAMVALFYSIPAIGALPAEIAAQPSAAAWGSLVALGVICSSIAFVAFFTLSRDIGVARASLVTYMNMAVAVILGILLLAEPITAGILIGFPLVLAGSYLATRKHR